MTFWGKNSIKTLNRYCKAILKVFFIQKCAFKKTKNFYLHDKLLVSNQSFTSYSLSQNCLQLQVFYKIFVQNFRLKGP